MSQGSCSTGGRDYHKQLVDAYHERRRQPGPVDTCKVPEELKEQNERMKDTSKKLEELLLMRKEIQVHRHLPYVGDSDWDVGRRDFGGHVGAVAESFSLLVSQTDYKVECRKSSLRPEHFEPFKELCPGLSVANVLHRPLEPAELDAFSFSKRLKPVGDVFEALLPRDLGELRVHCVAIVVLANDSGVEIVDGGAKRLVRDRVTDLLQELQMAESLSLFRLSYLSECSSYLRVPLDVSPLSEILVTSFGHALAGEGVLEVLKSLGALKRLGAHGSCNLRSWSTQS